jgi:hypothetical protein
VTDDCYPQAFSHPIGAAGALADQLIPAYANEEHQPMVRCTGNIYEVLVKFEIMMVIEDACNNAQHDNTILKLSIHNV